MSDAIARAKRWTLGSVRTSTNGKKYLAFDEHVQILVGGREVDLGKYRTLYFDNAVENAQFLLDNSHIDESAFKKKVDYITDKGISMILQGPLK